MDEDPEWWPDPPDAGDPPDAVDRVLEVSSMLAVFEADRLVRVAALHDEALADPTRYGGGSRELVERSLRMELAMAMRVSPYTADELLELADAVVHRYPAVLDSLAGARMTERHARVLVAAMDTLEPQLREDVLLDAVRIAETRPVNVARRLIGEAVEKARASTLEQRYAKAVASRRVVVEPAGDGMAWLLTYLPAVEAHAIFDRATAMAKAIKTVEGEARTLDQVRADVVADLLIEGSAAVHPNKARGIRAQVVVTVPALALLDNGDAGDGAGRDLGDPPMVDGLGPIPMSRARELSGGAKDWMRVLTHPETGMVLSVGRKKYRPPESLRRLTQWRSARCVGPGCGMPADRCQIDHQLAWAHGGHTSLENNAPMCEGCHTVKHHGGWVVRQLDGGVIEWISPTGRRYLVEPERRIPAFRFEPVDLTPAPF